MGPHHERYKNPPVVHVLAVVHLNPLGELIEGYINDLTGPLRALGYLDKIESEDLNFNINFLEWRTAEDGTTSPKLNVIKRKAWVFVHRSKRYSITISEDKVAFQCSEYEDFSSFEEGFAKAFRLLAKVVGENYVETRRLGLRYVNLLRLSDARPPAFWVRSDLLGGELGGIGHSRHHTFIERLYEVPPGLLAIRYSDLVGQPPLPIGINPLGLSIPKAVEAALTKDSRYALLDLDRSHHTSEDFDCEAVLRQFQAFNHSLQDFFTACTTDQAKTIWRNES